MEITSKIRVNQSFNKKILLIPILLIFTILLLTIVLPINLRTLRLIKIIAYPASQEIEDFKNENFKNENFDLLVRDASIISKLEFKSTYLEDAQYPENYQYKVNGKKGTKTDQIYRLNIFLFGLQEEKRFLKSSESIDPIDEKIFSGKLSIEDSNIKVKENLTTSLINLKNEFSFSSNKFENIELKNIEYVNKPTSINTVVFGAKINLYLGNCKKEITQNLVYSIEDKIWDFEDISNFVLKLCIPQFIQSGDKLIGTCTDCTLYPVNKKYGLRPEYLDNIIQFPLQTNALISSRILEDLTQLFTDARNAGHSIVINSSYRSYETQANTFEGWVQAEISLGRDRNTAEEIANSYSARAGFSEHQLGTTLDIATDQCNAFGKGCGPNEELWTWLKNNAYLYGFALSYPEGKEIQTGYVFEPWHYRWIGRTLSSEFKSLEATTTLQEFLFSKNNY